MYVKFADDTTTTLEFSIARAGSNEQTLFLPQNPRYAQSQDLTIYTQSSDGWCVSSVAMEDVVLENNNFWLDNPCSTGYSYTYTCYTSRAVSFVATAQPTMKPSRQPTLQPTRQPTLQPTRQPTLQPTRQPTHQPTRQPTHLIRTPL
jgi:hypothetical protein